MTKFQTIWEPMGRHYKGIERTSKGPPIAMGLFLLFISLAHVQQTVIPHIDRVRVTATSWLVLDNYVITESCGIRLFPMWLIAESSVKMHCSVYPLCTQLVIASYQAHCYWYRVHQRNLNTQESIVQPPVSVLLVWVKSIKDRDVCVWMLAELWAYFSRKWKRWWPCWKSMPCLLLISSKTNCTFSSLYRPGWHLLQNKSLKPLNLSTLLSFWWYYWLWVEML